MASVAQDFRQQHDFRIEEALSTALTAVSKARPDHPLLFLSQHLAHQAGLQPAPSASAAATSSHVFSSNFHITQLAGALGELVADMVNHVQPVEPLAFLSQRLAAKEARLRALELWAGVRRFVFERIRALELWADVRRWLHRRAKPDAAPPSAESAAGPLPKGGVQGGISLDDLLRQGDEQEHSRTERQENGELSNRRRSQNVQSESALVGACARGDTVRVKHFLSEQGVDPNVVDAQGQGGLLQAARGGHTETVLLLLKSDIDMSLARSRGGATPLLVAAQEGHRGVVATLLADARTEVNQADLEGWTPLLVAAQEGIRHTQ